MGQSSHSSLPLTRQCALCSWCSNIYLVNQTTYSNTHQISHPSTQANRAPTKRVIKNIANRHTAKPHPITICITPWTALDLYLVELLAMMNPMCCWGLATSRQSLPDQTQPAGKRKVLNLDAIKIFYHLGGQGREFLRGVLWVNLAWEGGGGEGAIGVCSHSICSASYAQNTR